VIPVMALYATTSDAHLMTSVWVVPALIESAVVIKSATQQNGAAVKNQGQTLCHGRPDRPFCPRQVS
jgi:hypothetical protein